MILSVNQRLFQPLVFFLQTFQKKGLTKQCSSVMIKPRLVKANQHADNRLPLRRLFLSAIVSIN